MLPDWLNLIEAHESTYVQIRRDLHRIPETAFEEHKTAAYIARTLKEWGFEPKTGVGRTGVTALLKGKGGPGPTLAIRADIDALAVPEATGLTFASEHPGFMHACGHDSHMAMALGAALVLSKIRDQLPGDVLFIFQPSEEQPTGAGAMIEDGVFDQVRPEAIIALHNWPNLPMGQLAFRSGPVTGSVDRFTVKVKGKGGHGAIPHETIDPIVAASHCVVALQTVVSRLNNPVKPLVVTVGAIHAGTSFNVIPDEAVMTGTVRAADPDTQKLIPEQMRQVLTHTAAAYGAVAELEYEWGIPSVVNDSGVTEWLQESLAPYFSHEQVVTLPEPSLVGEDYSLFLREVPGTFFFLGTGAPEGVGLHHPRYAIPEAILPLGVKAFVAAAWEFLHGNGLK